MVNLIYLKGDECYVTVEFCRARSVLLLIWSKCHVTVEGCGLAMYIFLFCTYKFYYQNSEEILDVVQIKTNHINFCVIVLNCSLFLCDYYSDMW